MPRKPGESTPHGGEGKMSEETGRELYGGSGSHQGPGRLEPSDEGGAPTRHTNAPSSPGSPKAPGNQQNT